jgi:hypothetical protein
MPTRTATLYAWAQVLYDKVLENYDLDLAYVAWAKPVSFRTALSERWQVGEQDFGEWDVIETIVRVHINEIITAMAV